MSDFAGLIIFALVIFGIGLAIFLNSLYEKKRSEEMQKVAKHLKWEFQRYPETEGLNTFDFKVFHKGHSKTVYNYMIGKDKKYDLEVFDYKYTIGYGKSSETHNQTMVFYNDPDETRPKFVLTREHFYHKFKDAFGYGDIDFDDFPIFSDEYYLTGVDEEAIREYFYPALLLLFQDAKPQFNIESSEDGMLFFRDSKRLSPEEIVDFMNMIEEYIKMFNANKDMTSEDEDDDYIEEDDSYDEYQDNYEETPRKIRYTTLALSKDTTEDEEVEYDDDYEDEDDYEYDDEDQDNDYEYDDEDRGYDDEEDGYEKEDEIVDHYMDEIEDDFKHQSEHADEVDESESELLDEETEMEHEEVDPDTEDTDESKESSEIEIDKVMEEDKSSIKSIKDDLEDYKKKNSFAEYMKSKK